MRGLRFAVAGLLVAGMVTIAQAQFRQGGGGPQGLVNNKAVQEDLKLSEEQVTKLKDWSTEFRKKSAEIYKEEGVEFGKGTFGKMDEETQKKFAAAGAKISKEAYKQLGDILNKDQLERVKQIERQQMGLRIFTNDEIVAALKLTDSQKTSVKGTTDDYTKERREIFGTPEKGKFDATKFQENQKKDQKLQKEYMGKLTELLDESQKKTLKDLTGAPFDLTKLNTFGNFGKKDAKKD